MPRLIILFLLSLLLAAFNIVTIDPINEKEAILGRWKLCSYDAIDKVKSSPGYINASAPERALIDEQFHAALNYTYYEFSADTLIYDDLLPMSSRLEKRRAMWKINENGIIEIEEIDRPYKRQLYLNSVNTDSLVLQIVLDGRLPSAKMVFARVKE